MRAWELAQAHRHQGVTRLFAPTVSDGEFADETIKALHDALEGSAASLKKLTNVGKITPLMVACRMKQLMAVEMLISGSATVNAQSAKGCTALYLTAEEGAEDIVRALLGKSADVDLVASDGTTPLHAACKFGHDLCARALLEAGADVNKEGPQGFSYLMVACQNGHEQVARATCS